MDTTGESLYSLKHEEDLQRLNRFVEETGNAFGDDSHIIYVNSQIKDETALGRLMHDFSCTDPSDMHYKMPADRVHYFKKEEEGVYGTYLSVIYLLKREWKT